MKQLTNIRVRTFHRIADISLAILQNNIAKPLCVNTFSRCRVREDLFRSAQCCIYLSQCTMQNLMVSSEQIHTYTQYGSEGL